MANRVPRNVAEAAAKWWADKLRYGANLDHGDDSATGLFTKLLAINLAQIEHENRTPEQIDMFETILADQLEEHFPQWGFGVDYGPDRTLTTACEAAGLTPGAASFPWKTTMIYSDGKLKVAEGYQAPLVEIEINDG